MNNQGKKKAKAKVTDLLSKPFDTHVSWDELSEYRLEALKNETWENAARLAILNYLQKEIPNQQPYLPKEMVDFLKPIDKTEETK